MLSSILIATDASDASDEVVDCVTGLRRLGSRIAVLVHAISVRRAGGVYATLKESATPQTSAAIGEA